MAFKKHTTIKKRGSLFFIWQKNYKEIIKRKLSLGAKKD
jgi:hypothetical protein